MAGHARSRTEPRRRGAALALLALVLTPSSSHAALNVGADAPDSMVRQLRESIFIDTAYLSEREEESCSSLDGPKCLAFMGGRLAVSTQPGAQLDGPGILPERMLNDLGAAAGDLDFTTPLYHELESLRRQLLAASSEERALTTGSDAAAFRASRAGAAHGALHFTDLQPDHRVPLSFSRGLPDGVVATWDGKWIVRSCLEATVDSLPGPSWPGLPASQSGELAPALLGKGRAPSKLGTDDSLSLVAKLSASVGYLRFSEPVVVRSLFAHWAPDKWAPPGVIAGRLGLETVWTTHVDPMGLNNQNWIDISGGSLAPVDEIAFLSTPGLELAALWGVKHSGDFTNGSSERQVMMLQPVFNASMGKGTEGIRFGVHAQEISPASTPFLMSLQEAIDRNLRLHAKPADWNIPHSHGVAAHYPAMLTSGTQGMFQWTPSALANQGMLEHDLLALLFSATSTANENLVDLMRKMSTRIPSDLRNALAREREAIAQSIRKWVSDGGKWRKSLPTSLPVQGSEAAVQNYMMAKQSQTKLDLVTAAFLYAGQELMGAWAE